MAEGKFGEEAVHVGGDVETCHNAIGQAEEEEGARSGLEKGSWQGVAKKW